MIISNKDGLSAEDAKTLEADDHLLPDSEIQEIVRPLMDMLWPDEDPPRKERPGLWRRL